MSVTNNFAAEALMREIERRYVEMDILYEEIDILLQAHAILTSGGGEPTTGGSFQAANLPEPETEAAAIEPTAVIGQEDKAEPEPAAAPAAPRRSNRSDRRGKRAGPDPKSAVECVNGMQFLRVWARNHGGLVNTEDAAGEMFKRDDLRSECKNVHGLAKILNSRLAVYKSFTRVDANLYRFTGDDEAKPAATGNARPQNPACPRCDNRMRPKTQRDSVGNIDNVLECPSCGHEVRPPPVVQETAGSAPRALPPGTHGS